MVKAFALRPMGNLEVDDEYPGSAMNQPLVEEGGVLIEVDRGTCEVESTMKLSQRAGWYTQCRRPS
jgi:hypothetical protein